MLGGYKASITSRFVGISLLILMRYAVNGYIQMSGSHTEAGIKWDDWARHWSVLCCMLSKSLNTYNQILNFISSEELCKTNCVSNLTTHSPKLQSFQEVKVILCIVLNPLYPKYHQTQFKSMC